MLTSILINGKYEGFHFGCLRILFLFFADDVVLLALGGGLGLTLEWFTARDGQ